MDAFTVIETGRALYGTSWRKPLARALAAATDGWQGSIEDRLTRLAQDRRAGKAVTVDPAWRDGLCSIVLKALEDGDRRPEVIAAARRFCG